MTRGREISGRGDVVTGLNGKPVETWPDLLSSVNDFEVGDRVTLDLVRNGDPIQIDITLAKWQDNCE